MELGAENVGIDLHLSAYPNPTNGYLTLKVADLSKENLTYQLVDITGKILESKKITAQETGIYMTNMAPAIYFLKVIDQHKELKTFKIMKN